MRDVTIILLAAATGTGQVEMIHFLFLLFLILGIIFLIVTIILGVVYRIPDMIRQKTGKAKRDITERFQNKQEGDEASV